MKMLVKIIDDKEYTVVVQYVSDGIYQQVHDVEEYDSQKEIPLNDYALYGDNEELPYSIKINTYIKNAIKTGAELIWFRNTKNRKKYAIK